MKLLNNYVLEEAIGRINLLRSHEKPYQCIQYLSTEYQQQLPMKLIGSRSMTSVNASFMTPNWRDKIGEWFYTIVDFFNYDREFVFICMDYLDRYAMKRRVTVKTYQLAAMTALFIVTKTYGSSSAGDTLDISSLTKLSQSIFNENDILAMEGEMLQTLGWYLFPPTPFSFANELLIFIEAIGNSDGRPRLNPNTLQEIKELTRFLTELSVCDCFFITQNSSTTGFACLLNAIEFTTSGNECQFPFELKEECMKEIYLQTRLDPSRPEVLECKRRIKETFVLGGFHQCSQDLQETQTESSTDVSIEAPGADEKGSMESVPSPICISGATI